MHTVIINGSPRVAQYSNTEKIIGSLIKGISEKGGSVEKYALSDRMQWEAARNAFANNTNILIALPLYVECVPGLLLEFLESLEPKTDGKTRISFLLQSGFAEGCQLRCGEKFLEKLPEQLGCEYGGTLVKGDNFSFRVVEGKKLEKALAPYIEMGKVYGRDGAFECEEAKKFTGPEIFPKSVQLLLAFAFKTFARRNFEKVARSWGCEQPLDYKPYTIK